MKYVNSYFKSKKILFLGYDTNSTRLIKELEIRGYETIHCENNIQFDNYYLAISFGYRHILSSKTIRAIDCQLLIFTCFLFCTRTSIFWAFYDGNRCGVTIHELNEGIDDGPIILEKSRDR